MWLVLVSALGFAQSPFSFGPKGEARWVTEDVTAQRFLAHDEETRGPRLSTGDEVEMIVTEGDLVRIKKGDRYGWVAASALTDQAPDDDDDDASSIIDSSRLLTPTSP